MNSTGISLLFLRLHIVLGKVRFLCFKDLSGAKLLKHFSVFVFLLEPMMCGHKRSTTNCAFLICWTGTPACIVSENLLENLMDHFSEIQISRLCQYNEDRKLYNQFITFSKGLLIFP